MLDLLINIAKLRLIEFLECDNENDVKDLQLYLMLNKMRNLERKIIHNKEEIDFLKSQIKKVNERFFRKHFI